MGTFKDLTGKKFGMLTVIEQTDKKTKNGNAIWICRCECGNIKEIGGSSLNYYKSCGCLRMARSKDFGTRMTKHSESRTRLYSIWSHMKDRCNNPKNKRYKDYGGRGISVCKEWLNSYDLFSKWAKDNGYNDDLTIDRIDNNGNYEPTNCRWATNTEQVLNRRSNKIIEYHGKRQSLKAWSIELDISYDCLQTRLARDWTVEEAFNTPVNERRKRVV